MFSSRSSAAGSAWSSLAARTKFGIGLYFQRSQYGLAVKSIVKGSAADVCGRVAIGDVIVAVDGEPVQNASLTGSYSEKSAASDVMF
jgi:C-terminal processing protease CtpA/Prc